MNTKHGKNKINAGELPELGEKTLKEAQAAFDASVKRVGSVEKLISEWLDALLLGAAPFELACILGYTDDRFIETPELETMNRNRPEGAKLYMVQQREGDPYIVVDPDTRLISNESVDLLCAVIRKLTA